MRLLQSKHHDSLCYRVRSAMGLSQREFAREVGVSQMTITNWESGKKPPSGPAEKMLRSMEKNLN